MAFDRFPCASPMPFPARKKGEERNAALLAGTLSAFPFLRHILERGNYSVQECGTLSEARVVLGESDITLVIASLEMRDGRATDLITTAVASGIECYVVTTGADRMQKGTADGGIGRPPEDSIPPVC
jgi:hypothetical protein